MIRGNVMDVFSVSFSNGEKFCLVARDASSARLTAQELNKPHTVTSVHLLDEWENHLLDEWENND